MTQRTSTYDPRTFRALTFYDAVPRFLEGTDTPSDYLDRCLATIDAREPVVQAWVSMNVEGARQAAEAATVRYRQGRPLSAIDGMPIGIKDLIETRDMPTQMGSDAYAANFTHRDSPLVRALRDAGAVVLGKTVTTELGMSHPGPTTNPFNPAHTPGGSSSGSAAVIGASMVPVAIGSQVGGSIIRPASYCGNHALKPTLGALSRGDRLGLSQAVVGVHAGCPEDQWQVAAEIVARAGGDPGFPGLYGPATPPAPHRPARLIVMETEGWAVTDNSTREAFERLLGQLQDAGVELLRRADNPLIDAFERSIAQSKAMCGDINAYELRFGTLDLQEKHAGKVSQRMLNRMKHGQTMTLNQYRLRLQQREDARRHLASLAPLADALIALSSPGPAPIWEGDTPGQPLAPMPTGDYACNAATSALGAPAATIPMLGINGLPVGVQIVGQAHADARICAIAHWIFRNIEPIALDQTQP